MKVFLSLISLGITLGLCHGYCFRSLPKAEIINGKVVIPEECTDLYDGSKHPLEAEWNTAHCLRCSCRRDGLGCCTRYGGIANMEGCKGVLDQETCRYKFYDIDDPTKLCPNQLYP